MKNIGYLTNIYYVAILCVLYIITEIVAQGDVLLSSFFKKQTKTSKNQKGNQGTLRRIK